MNEPAPIFTVEGGQLVISDATTGETRWQGRLLDASVSDVKAIPGTDRAVVLLDYMSHGSGPFRNLVCVDSVGQVVWAALLPSQSNTDAYVSFDLSPGLVTAKSWSGYYVELDSASGRILDTTFTK